MVTNSKQVLYNMIYLKAIFYKLQEMLKHIIYLVIRELKIKLLLDIKVFNNLIWLQKIEKEN